MRASFFFGIIFLLLGSFVWGEDCFLDLQERVNRSVPVELKEKVSIAFTDLVTGKSIGIHDRQAVNPASVIKVPVMVEVYLQAKRGVFRFSDTIQLKKSDKVWGAGPLFGCPVGQRFTIQHLVECMIHYSDNTATKMLIDFLGKGNINISMRRLGLQQTVIGTSNLLKAEGLNFSSPRDMNLLLSKISRGEVASTTACNDMILLLSQQKYRWGIPKPIPKEILVANKTGTLDGIKHDSGLVLADHAPYVLTVFTTHIPSMYTAMGIIAKISEETYLWSKIAH